MGAGCFHGSGGFHGFQGFHGFRGFRSGPFPFPFRPNNFGRGFQGARSGWAGGPYSAGVADFDSDEGDGFAGGDLHFRVQESFGPGDIGRPTPPQRPEDYGQWDAARMDPWHGYGPDS
jgi:hypothetical protein